jgi:glycerol uptake facilitator protein
MSPYLAEFLGTAILIIFGEGVVANVVLSRTKGNNAGWIVITFGWGMAVFVAVLCVARYSGAHINPAVTLALAAANKFDDHFKSWTDVPLYILCQMAGAFVGALIVYAFHLPYFRATEDPDAKLAVFATAPNIRNYANAFFCETVGTFLLVLPIFLMVSPTLSYTAGIPTKLDMPLGLGALGALPVGLLVFAIGLSLGGTTGYAINPARDLAPRLAHAILPIENKRDSDWSYAWIPALAPLVGGLLAALVARNLSPV